MQEDFKSSISLFEEAIKIYSLNLGDSHTIVTSSLNNLKIALEKCELDD